MSQFIPEFGTIALAHFLALISPGPDFLLIVAASVRVGASRATGVCVGIAAANAIYILFALTGFAVIKENPLLFAAIKAACALYLIYLGGMLLKASRRRACAVAPDQDGQASSWGRLFATGFLSAILNPKNAVFYLSLFAVIVDQRTPRGIQALYGFWMFLAVLGWDLLVARSMGSHKVRCHLDNSSHWIEKCSGGFLLVLGAGLLFR